MLPSTSVHRWPCGLDTWLEVSQPCWTLRPCPLLPLSLPAAKEPRAPGVGAEEGEAGAQAAEGAKSQGVHGLSPVCTQPPGRGRLQVALACLKAHGQEAGVHDA